ncbi:unnamed protein product [Withania somnifera]
MPSCLSNNCSLKFLANTTKKRNVYEEDEPLSQKEKCEVKLLKSLAPPLMTALISLSPIVNPPVSVGQTIDIQKGAALFNRACIGCHYEGGNIIQPGFGENCTPRGQCTFVPRLQDDEIKLLAEFVKSQADQGWPKIESSGD